MHAFATEGAHCTKVRDILDASDVSPDSHACLCCLNDFAYNVRSLDVYLLPEFWQHITLFNSPIYLHCYIYISKLIQVKKRVKKISTEECMDILICILCNIYPKTNNL